MYFDTLLKTSAPDKQPNSHIFPLILFLLSLLSERYKLSKDLTQLYFEGFQYSPL